MEGQVDLTCPFFIKQFRLPGGNIHSRVLESNW
jgi:hypothetical protein